MSAFQKRAEGELEKILEKIVAMLNAYYSLASPSPVGNMETAAVAPAASVDSDEIRTCDELIWAMAHMEEEIRGLLRQGMAHWEKGEEAQARDIFTRATARTLSAWAKLRGKSHLVSEDELKQLIEHARAFAANSPEPEDNLTTPLFWEAPSNLPGREFINDSYKEAKEVVRAFSSNGSLNYVEASKTDMPRTAAMAQK